MTETTASSRESYGQTGNPVFEAQLVQRTALNDAAFLIPYLQPGMALLDVGCGPGSITLGLASIAAPGEVIGIEIQPDVVERARELAAAEGVHNVRFEVGDCYKLPFPDESFDVCFANSLLQHLREPVAALAEMRRVLRPGGFAGVRDLTGLNIFIPDTPLLKEALALNTRIRHNGGNPDAGFHHREYLAAAGFSETLASATVDTAGSIDETRRTAAFICSVLRGTTRTALAEAWITQADVDAMLAAIEAWGEKPDAFSVMTRCNAIGWARN